MDNNSTMMELGEDTGKCDECMNGLTINEESLRELLHCSVCLRHFDSSNKCLPCQHTFCETCVCGIILTSEKLICPLCRNSVEVDIKTLPSNILINNLLECVQVQLKQVDNSTDGASTSAASSSSSQQPTLPPQPQLSRPRRSLRLMASATDPSAEKKVHVGRGQRRKQPYQTGPVEFRTAISFVNKVQKTFAGNLKVYEEFLFLLSMTARMGMPPNPSTIQRIKDLFIGHPELIDGFNEFYPDYWMPAKNVGGDAESKNS